MLLGARLLPRSHFLQFQDDRVMMNSGKVLPRRPDLIGAEVASMLKAAETVQRVATLEQRKTRTKHIILASLITGQVMSFVALYILLRRASREATRQAGIVHDAGEFTATPSRNR